LTTPRTYMSVFNTRTLCNFYTRYIYQFPRILKINSYCVRFVLLTGVSCAVGTEFLNEIFIHSFCILSDDTYIAPSKASSPQIAI